MFKKVLIFTAVLSILATNSVFALHVSTEPYDQPAVHLEALAEPYNGHSDGYISNYYASSGTFNPENESENIYFNLSTTSQLYVYVVDDSDDIVAVISNYVSASPGSVSFTWYGRANNSSSGTILPDGIYTVKAFAYVGGVVQGSGYVDVAIDTTGNNVDFIENLTLDPSSDWNPEDESLQIEFDILQGVDNLQIEAKKGGNTVEILDRNDVSEQNNYTKTWNGKDDDGDYVADGTWEIRVTADGDTLSKDIYVDKSGSNNDDNLENLRLTPSSDWNPEDESLRIKFDILDDVDNLQIEAKKGSTTVDILDRDDISDQDDYTKTWNGKDEDGDYVADGSWQIRVTADGDTLSKYIDVDKSGTHHGDNVENLRLSPSSNWDPDERTLKITFDLTDDIDRLKITAKKSSTTITILDRDNVDSQDDYTKTWTGKDSHGDYIDSGTWKITVDADGDTVYKNISVEESDTNPRISNAFVTKNAFDPDQNEFINLVFRADADGVAKVELYKGNSREFTLVNSKSINEDQWYAVKWDGKDEDHDLVNNGTDWKFRLTVKGKHGTSTSYRYVDFDVNEDNESSDIANITKDYTDPIVSDRDSTNMEINYCVDDDADVYMAIYKGESSGGTMINELMDYEDVSRGCHRERWNLRDDDGDKLAANSFYSYKIISESHDNERDTEIGKFVVTDDNGGGGDDDNFDNCQDIYSDLGGIRDQEMCDAIAWAYDQDILTGYSDGSFRTYGPINRAEVLRVILEAYDADILSSNGTNLGFNDVDPDAWYMPYLRTARFHGLFDGYNNGTEARPGNTINRAELLKFVLEAGAEFGNLDLNDDFDYTFDDVHGYEWFARYAGIADEYNLFEGDSEAVNLMPGRLVSRGEMALVLYRMSEEGLL